jgi:hypothetical protein
MPKTVMDMLGSWQTKYSPASNYEPVTLEGVDQASSQLFLSKSLILRALSYI